MKRIIAITALVAWQMVTASSSLAQQRPGSTSTSQARTQQQQVRNQSGQSKTKATQAREGGVQQAGYEGIVVGDGSIVHEGAVGGAPCDSCGSAVAGGCGSCTVSGYDDLCYRNYGRLYISLPAHGWVHMEGLSWHQSGMNLPPLVTTSPAGTSRAAAGVLPAASVLFGGNDDAFSEASGGFRLRFGTWLASVPGLGLEGEYVSLSEQNLTFNRQSNGSEILGRPFFNTQTGLNDAELISFPNVVSGSVAVHATNKLDGGAFRFRRQMCCSSGCGFSDWACQTVPVSTRLDLTLGYRFWQLQESLGIQENLTSLLAAPNNGSFVIVDQFRTRNQFNGAEFGVVWQGRRGWWSLDTLLRVGVGNVFQSVFINGSTTITGNTGTPNSNGTYPNNGILAQPTNSPGSAGRFERDRFTMVPELGLTLGYQMTRRLRGTIGYSLIYWGNVVRPGDQIDLAVNPNQFAPAVTPLTGASLPQFTFNQTDYWVQGLSFGAEFRW